MIQTEMIREDGRPEWDAFISQHEHALPYHLYAAPELIETLFGHKAFYLVARRGGQLVGALPLSHFDHRLFGRQLVSLPFFEKGGLFATDPAAVSALWKAAVELARSLKVKYLELRSAVDLGIDTECKQDKVSFHLDVHDGEDAVWQRIGGKVRNQIRKAERAGLTVQDGGAELLDAFYAVFCENMRDLGTPVVTKTLFRDIIDRFGEQVKIFTVLKEAKPIAGSFCFIDERKMEVPWASHLKRYNHDNPNMLLYWTMIRHAARCSAKIFDFGRGTRAGGTHRFKKQWKGREVQHYWYYWFAGKQQRAFLRPDNPLFDLPIKTWQKLPLWTANWLGPKVVKYIP